MNKSKKLQVNNVKKDKLTAQKPITKTSLPWLVAFAVLVVGLIAALLFDQLYKPTIMEIDGKGYTISDLSYYFYTVESKYNYYDSMFGGGGAYWDMTVDDEGNTVRDLSKTEAVNLALFNEVLYNQAKTDGYSLTDEEKKTISDNVDLLIGSQIPPADIRKNNFTKAYLTDVLGKITLADRYREDKIAQLNIDVEEIKKDINYEDYRQYDIETISIATKSTDDSGNIVDLTAEQKQAAYDKIKNIYEAAKTTEDWSTLIPDDEEELTLNSDNYFLKDDALFSEDMKNKMMTMNNGDVSEIFEEANAYYIVRMVNNNSSESYDVAVEDAVSAAEDKAFSDMFDNEILPKHEYTIKDKSLKRYTMGFVTVS